MSNKVVDLPERLGELRPRLVHFPELQFEGDNERFIKTIEDLGNGEAILDYRFFVALSRTGLRASFKEDKNKFMEGRDTGVHKSYAGYLALRSKKDQEVKRTVFVKPFRDGFDCRNGQPARDMTHEIAASQAISKIYDYPVAFKTLGIARSYNGTLQHITEYNMGVTAVSNIFRPESPSPLQPTEDQVAKAIHIAMNQAGAWVGGLGATHRDFHAGNVARGIENTPWFNDNETARSLPDQKDGSIGDTRDNRKRVLSDLNRFFYSIADRNRTRRDVINTVQGVVSNPRRVGSFLKTYHQTLAVSSAMSGIELPEKYYMSQSNFTTLVRASIAEGAGE